MNTSEIPASIQVHHALRDELACPRCAGPVRDAGNGLVCTDCGASYPVHDGIADFRCHRHDYYFNPVPRAEMEALTRDAQSQPWEKTIHRFLERVGQNPEWFDDLVVDGRYAWKLFLRLPKNARVLDLGCGLGNLVKNIAPNAGHVDALDLTLERLKFARIRFQQANLSERITVLAGGDGTYLPFPDSSFDCVTLSGVLEWVAADDKLWNRGSTRAETAKHAFMSFFDKRNPRLAQIRFLTEIRRILKPQGQLFVAIENRLSHCYFGGRRDHHSGLWFASLLPRFFANLYSILVRHQPYRTYTYSMNGYRRLLRAAGFPQEEFYGLTPGYTQLAELIPLQRHDRLWRPWKAHGVDRLKRSRNFVPAYGIVAYPEAPGRPSLAEQLAASLEQQLGSEPGAACFTRFQVTDKNKGIISASVDGRPVVVKLPFNEAIGARAARNHQFLAEAREHESLQTYLPRALGAGEILGIRYYAEERVAGHPLLDELDAGNGMRWFDAATSFLEAVNPGPRQGKPEVLTAEMLQRQVSAPLERLACVADATLVERVDGYLRRSLAGLSVRLGVVHGDFGASNVFVQSGAIVGVIDWDDIDLMGIPALDALNFVDSLYRGSNRHSSAAQVISRLARWDELANEEKDFLEKSYRRCGIESSHHLALVCLYWLRHVADQLDGDMIYDKPAIDERITMTFDELLRIGHDGCRIPQ